MTAGSPSVHDASEGPDQPAHTLPERRAGAPRHVACVDCHDPHAATAILGSGPRASGPLAGAWGIEEDSDKALFPDVDISTAIGRDGSIRLKMPFTIAAMGSTNVAKNNWAGIAAGAAITGTGFAVGENVCGMDMESKIEGGKVISSVDLEFRVKAYREWQQIGSPNPQLFALGVKEVWQTKRPLDRVVHTLGWPLPNPSGPST